MRLQMKIPSPTTVAAVAFACVLLLGVLATAAGASATPAGSITEYSSGLNAKTEPEAIAPGPDGNMWFIDGESPPAIGKITPSGAITEYSGLNAEHDLEDIALGPDGNMWFTDAMTFSSGAIWRITPSGALGELAPVAANAPSTIAPGPGGNLWFTTFGGATKAIGKITPSATISEYFTGLNPGSEPSDIAPGADGNVWFTDRGTTKAIGKITPSGAITEFTEGLNVESFPASIAAGPDGNVWFTDAGTTKTIGKITPSGAITEYPTAALNPGSEPVDITPGPDGNLWFTDQGTTKAIGKITPSGAITEYSVGLSGSRPLDIAPGPDGNLWFSDRGTKAIGRVGAGVPEALAAPLLVSGAGQAGSPQLCSASWSTWAGQQPSATLYGFDGYRWLLDGSQIATGPSYTPAAANVGHQLSCAETVTYPLLEVTTSATSAPITVVASPATTTVVPPRITTAHQSSSRWREGGKLARISRKKPPIGTTFSFSLNEQASVSFAFTQQVPGRRVGRNCVAQTKKNRRKHACKRTVTAGTLSFTGHTGTNKVVFQGRVSSSKKLKPGRYTLIITATNSVGAHSAAPTSLTFTIVR